MSLSLILVLAVFAGPEIDGDERGGSLTPEEIVELDAAAAELDAAAREVEELMADAARELKEDLADDTDDTDDRMAVDTMQMEMEMDENGEIPDR